MNIMAQIKWLRRNWLQLLLGAGIVLSLLITHQSQSVQKCLSSYSYHNQKQPEEEKQSAFRIFLYGTSSCVNEFFARNTGAITAVTAIIVTILTISLTNAASKQSDASIRQAESSKISAETARKNVELFESSAHRTERAYIVSKTPEVELLAGGVRMRVLVRNAGKTYGTVVRTVCKLTQFPPGNLPETPTYSGFVETFPHLPIVELPVRVGEDSISHREVVEGHHIFFIGYFEYTDIFNSTHYTRFCWRALSKSIPVDDGSLEIRWSFHRAGGDAYNNTNDDPPEHP